MPGVFSFRIPGALMLAIFLIIKLMQKLAVLGVRGENTPGTFAGQMGRVRGSRGETPLRKKS